MNLKSAQMKKFRGFTLIELLITIAIMGILAAAVLVAINPAKRQAQAKDANVKSDITNIVTGLQTYFTSKGAYPKDTTAMADLVANGDLTSTITPPTGVYTFTTAPGACTTAALDCTGISVRYALFDPAAAGNVWCFRSSLGKASEMAVAACTAP